MTSSTNPYPGGISGRKAAGGKITGPGGPRADTAGLFALSNGEFVHQAAAVSKYGVPAMEAVNAGKAVIGYASGGPVGVNVTPVTPSYKTINDMLTGSVMKLATAFAATLGGSGPAIVSYARSFLGKIPYVFGGNSLSGGIDCSGFTQQVYGKFGIHAPRTSEAQYGWATRSGPVPGGLAFYVSPGGGPPPGHVAIVQDANSVISQGGGMGPKIEGLHFLPLMGTGIPAGGFPGGAGGNGPIGGGPGPAAAQAWMRAHLGDYGWGAGQWPSLLALWNGESGWRVDAQNPASPAYGIPQADPGSKMATVGADWRTNPVTQMRWGAEYIRFTNGYGTPANAYSKWLSRNPHWYAGAAWSPGSRPAGPWPGRPPRT